jgi:hypothetical protein
MKLKLSKGEQMFSEKLVMDSIDNEWNVLVWASQRGIVKSNKSAVVKHFKQMKRYRIMMAVGCGCSLCLKAVSHLEV